MATIRDLTDGQLAEYMGSDATIDEARCMRVRLLSGGYTDTTDVPEGTWRSLLELAVKDAQASA